MTKAQNGKLKLKKTGGLFGFIFKDKTAAIICASPFIIGFILFMIVPMVLSLYYSFTDFNLMRSDQVTWVGFDNYARALFKNIDPQTGYNLSNSDVFWKSVGQTFTYTILAVPLRLVVALLVAMMLLKTNKLNGFLRSAYYLPSMLGGSVAVAILWRMMFGPSGVINKLIRFIVPGMNYNWLGNEASGVFVLILLAVWQFGSSMLIFLASLKQIPEQLYEAASIDGAKKGRQFFKVTLPLITPTIFFNLVMQMINGLLVFTQAYVVFGQNDPNINPIMLEIYRRAIGYFQAGRGSAMAWILILFVALFTGLLFLTKRFWVYEGGL